MKWQPPTASTDAREYGPINASTASGCIRTSFQFDALRFDHGYRNLLFDQTFRFDDARIDSKFIGIV